MGNTEKRQPIVQEAWVPEQGPSWSKPDTSYRSGARTMALMGSSALDQKLKWPAQ